MTKAKAPYRIVWRPIAEADLDNIIDYIAQEKPARAEEFGQELRDKTLPLAQHPKLGRAGRPGLPAFLRELAAHRNYIIFLPCAGRGAHRRNFESEAHSPIGSVITNNPHWRQCRRVLAPDEDNTRKEILRTLSHK